MESSSKTHNVITRQEGGAVTSYESIVIFTGLSSFFKQSSKAWRCSIGCGEYSYNVYGQTVITNNTATSGEGGGIYLHQNKFVIAVNCTVSQNRAVKGGGIYAKSSSITMHQHGILNVTNNSAENGGGIYLEMGPKLNLMVGDKINGPDATNVMIFTKNHANYGGATYVEGNDSSVDCSSHAECFIETLTLDQDSPIHNPTNSMTFLANTANKYGSDLFGGLLDRCTPSPFADVYRYTNRHTINQSIDGVTYPLPLFQFEFVFAPLKVTQTAVTSLHWSLSREEKPSL